MFGYTFLGPDWHEDTVPGRHLDHALRTWQSRTIPLPGKANRPIAWKYPNEDRWRIFHPHGGWVD